MRPGVGGRPTRREAARARNPVPLTSRPPDRDRGRGRRSVQARPQHRESTPSAPIRAWRRAHRAGAEDLPGRASQSDCRQTRAPVPGRTARRSPNPLRGRAGRRPNAVRQPRHQRHGRTDTRTDTADTSRVGSPSNLLERRSGDNLETRARRRRVSRRLAGRESRGLLAVAAPGPRTASQRATLP